MPCAAEDLLGDDSEDDEDDSPSSTARQPEKVEQSTNGAARTGTPQENRVEPGPGLQEKKMEILT